MNYFGRNLRYLREQLQLTQDEMAKLTGIKNTTLSNYENGVSEPSMEGLINISNFFGVTLDELITGDVPTQIDGEVKQRKHKPYTVNTAVAQVQEQQAELKSIARELRKLRQDVDAMKKSNKN